MSEESQSNSKTDSAANGDCRPVLCSRWVLLMRHHDTRSDRWSAWEEPSKADLYAKYGITPEQWRDTCKRWVEIGGTYEFKIVRRTDVVEWSIHYANV